MAHGEGQALFPDEAVLREATESGLVPLHYADDQGNATEAYPFNPNGSPGGLTSVTTADGRFTAMMPHPERVFRNIQMSWTSGNKSDASPWLRMFRNARKWVG